MEFEKFASIIADQLSANVDDITPDTSFADDLNADSLDLLQVIVTIEDELYIHIDDDELQNIKKVGDAYELVKANL